ncbi:MAG: type II toxin-antitoxin system RelE/ParE family toxin [Pirellulaceae bacterium]|jgi:toxin ParE1/3/4|nr:type II toxin-antitoxin system RelE/ParE family toxin [Pirellulaceae bacterium]
MLKPYYTAAAIEDLEEILTFIAKDKPGASLNWVEKIEAKCLLIAAAPDIGDQMPNLGQNVRASMLGRYVIFHRYAGGRLEILRVIPGGAETIEL